jgi:hypothetical protein
MRTFFLVLLTVFSLNSLGAQTRIDGSFPFQTDPAKKYSLYIPAGYNPAVPHKMVLGLHALNTSRWNAKSWCDTLLAFSAANDILLVCPDGGADGAINDPIDTAFTRVLLDSVALWYNIDTNQRYIMGFSWGGLTTYTYGLNHADDFCGFMPIGAAIAGSGTFTGIAQNAAGKPFYLVHGANDAVNTRYYPALNTLNASNANVNSLLMPGVGHTIDFPNRNQILSTAFEWLEAENSCDLFSATGEAKPRLGMEVLDNVLATGELLRVQISVPAACAFRYRLLHVDGKTLLAGKLDLQSGENSLQLRIPQAAAGVLHLLGQCAYGSKTVAVVVH